MFQVETQGGPIEFEVVGFDQVEPADESLTHSMTLLSVYAQWDFNFDAPEPANPDAKRAENGNNRWDQSALRQWMNSAGEAGTWWQPQHQYDAAPAYAETYPGFISWLPNDFASVVAPAKVITALGKYDGSGQVETVDKFWLPSIAEIMGKAINGVYEGSQMTRFEGASATDRIKYEPAYGKVPWITRSPSNVSSASDCVMTFDTSGIAQPSRTITMLSFLVPACIIA